MQLSDVVNSDAGLTVLGTVLGGLWTFFQSTALYDRMRNRRSARALEALEAGVSQTYEVYVRAIKEARTDGKLTEDERRNARAMARKTAVEYGRTEGIDVVRELGDQYLNLWIERLVKKLKSE